MDMFEYLDNAGRPNITAEKHILCYLWFVGHESASYRDVADRFGITLSTLYYLISRVTDFIMLLAPTIIKYPTLAEKEETATFYRERKRFPHIIGNIIIYVCLFIIMHVYCYILMLLFFPGAIDGTHVRIDKPQEDAESYINRKQYFSIHIQGTVNHDMRFIDVFVGFPGSVHDARVFKNSPLRNDLHELCAGQFKKDTNNINHKS